MASPLLILFASAVVVGFLATVIVVVAVSVDSWEYGTYDLSVLQSVNVSCKPHEQTECQMVEISQDPLLIRYDEFSDNISHNESRFLYSTHSGLWRVCDDLNEKLRSENMKARRSNYNGHRCFTFVTDYNEETDLLNKGFKQIARLQNSAASCYIVVLIDLGSAAVVGILGLVHKQVASCMVAGVLYLMSALFGVFALSMFHTKDYYEKYQCYAIDEIPPKACDARIVTIGYAVPLAWFGVVTCALASAIWLFVSRVLRVIRAKTML